MRRRVQLNESLTAVLSGAAATTNPKVFVESIDSRGTFLDKTQLSGATPVTIFTGNDPYAPIVTGITLTNDDSATITVTINHVIGGTAFPIVTLTLAVGDTLFMPQDGPPHVLDSSGNLKLGFQSTTTTFTGDVTLSDGKNLIFQGTTGQPEIEVPDNLVDALSVKVTGGSDLLTFDTSTGALVVNVGASVRLNVLGSAQIGNATADLVGFHGATPTDQCAAYTQTFSTAGRTHSARTATALTVADGVGTNDGTIGAITDNASTIAAVQELAAAINKIIVDLANTAGLVNSLVDDAQEKGLCG